MSAKNATITKDQAKEELLRIKTILDKTPTKKEFFELRELKGCHKQAIDLLFGKNSFTEFQRYAGLSLNVKERHEPVRVSCSSCDTSFLKQYSQIKNSENHFCSRSCSATYNNKRKLKSEGKYVIREKTCLNCSTTYHKDGRNATNTCSMLCYMELGMKQRLMKDTVKRKRS